jgi:hypothetical protein
MQVEITVWGFFYAGEGGRLLRRYRWRLLAPYAVELVFVFGLWPKVGNG